MKFFGRLEIFIIILPYMSNWVWMESNKKEYLALKDMRHRLVKLQHHEKVYCRSLSGNVILKGLRLKKTPLIEVSLWLKKQWCRVLYEAE